LVIFWEILNLLNLNNMEKKNICDICGEYSDTLYLDLSSGLWLCPECYFANDFDDEFDIDDDFDVE